MIKSKKGAAVRKLSGSTVRFMYCYSKLFVCIGKKKLFFVFFFETTDRYTTGSLLELEK